MTLSCTKDQLLSVVILYYRRDGLQWNTSFKQLIFCVTDDRELRRRYRRQQRLRQDRERCDPFTGYSQEDDQLFVFVVRRLPEKKNFIETVSDSPLPPAKKKKKIETSLACAPHRSARYTMTCVFVIPHRIAIVLVYFGLSINATDIAGGNKYLNFSLVALVEIPACVLNWMVMEGLSRKMALSSMFVLSGITSVAYALAPSREYLLARSAQCVVRILSHHTSTNNSSSSNVRTLRVNVLQLVVFFNYNFFYPMFLTL